MTALIQRINFGKIKERGELPHFLEYQLNSYEDFLQFEKAPEERENKGLEQILREFFPIESTYGNLKLEYINYKLDYNDFPLNDEMECKKRAKTYSLALKVKLRLIDNKGNTLQENWVYFCDVPKMTDRATFIINGAERVVVAQLHRSPGVFFAKDINIQSGKDIFSARIIPYKGTWIDIETTKEDTIIVKIDRKKKISLSLFLKSLGFFKNNIEILEFFFEKKKINLRKMRDEEIESILEDNFLGEDLADENTGEILLEKGTYITKDLIDTIKSSPSISYWEVPEEKVLIANSLANDNLLKDEPEIEFFKKIRPNDIVTLDGAKNFIYQNFFDSQRYDFGAVGRYKINQRLNLNVPEDHVALTQKDILASLNYVLDLFNGEGYIDDIDSLSCRRVRGIGELLSIQVKSSLSRIERNAKEKMAMTDAITLTPQAMLNTKFLHSSIMDFFASGQLSQFMDQSNPLAELTHKRRISSLGPGGLSRDRATFDVRDVHSSHYGRICPIETPEGPNIGLIVSLATYSRINKYGFIETPYAKVENSKVLFNKIDYLTYEEEIAYFIAQADTPVEENGNISSEEVVCRYGHEEVVNISKDKVNYIDLSPKQLVSVSSALIPFLEHDDANRALTGSNMQRQAVPLIKNQAPYVGTGMERKTAIDSGVLIIAKEEGVVTAVDASKIIVKGKKEETVYSLMNFVRSNHGMSMNQKPLVDLGQKVKKGDILADGPSTERGDLSLGKDVLIAFMPWEGYNFEDAILISERLVKDDTFTSIHIEEYEIECRTTKLGDEEITKEIPNISEDSLKHLDDTGIVRIGAEVKAGDVLVGKITPKGETDSPAEEKLLRAIFGEKARDVRDTSLKLPHGAKGVVVDILELSKEAGDSLPSGVNRIIRVYVAEKRKITVGDKMCGRHGNKGVVSRILPIEDMPYLPDGTPIDIVLNPLGVPSRMNIGQVLETHLGWAAYSLGLHMATPVFDGAEESEIKFYLRKAGLSEDGKSIVYDGRTGEPFYNRVTVGYMYMLKLHHLVEDKMHARAIGPYSLVTQQPLGGKAQFGGQRLGEMEVWALEAYGASNILREMLTIKSDDISGRTKTYEAIVKGGDIPEPEFPESFKVLIREFNSLCLNIDIYDENNNLVNIGSEKSQLENLSEFSLSNLNDTEGETDDENILE